MIDVDEYRNTTNHKKELLIDSGYKELRDSILFKKNNMIILSPTVVRNSNGRYIFKICTAALSYVTLCDKFDSTIVFIRVVPNGFVAVSLSELKQTRTHTDKMWDFELTSNFSIVVNIHSSSMMFPVYLMSEKQAKCFCEKSNTHFFLKS